MSRAGERTTPHLLIVNHYALAPDMGGGTRHVELGRELVRRGWRVTIAASDFSVLQRSYLRRRSASDRSPITEEMDGVRFRWLWASPYVTNDRRRALNWLTFARSVLRSVPPDERPDIVLGSTPHLPAAAAARVLAWRKRAPFVLEVRDLWPESLAVGEGRRGLAYWVLWATARLLYRASKRIIVLARGVAEYLERRGVPASRIAFVPNGADVAAFSRALDAPRDRLRLVYAGAHGPANGLDAVLDAADELRTDARVSFVLLGDGASKSALQAAAAARRLTNVEFAAILPKADVPRFLAECDGGLMVLKDVPLFSFGVSPNKLFDYWGAGLPVVCNVPGEVAGWVRDARGGVQAKDGSGSALATAIRSLLVLSPAERQAMGARGREWVRREHDRPVLAARLDETLRGLLASR